MGNPGHNRITFQRKFKTSRFRFNSSTKKRVPTNRDAFFSYTAMKLTAHQSGHSKSDHDHTV